LKCIRRQTRIKLALKGTKQLGISEEEVKNDPKIHEVKEIQDMINNQLFISIDRYEV